MPMTPFSSTKSISISYRQKAVSQHRGPRNRSVVSKPGRQLPANERTDFEPIDHRDHDIVDATRLQVIDDLEP